MRIISQDGTIDLDYESNTFSIYTSEDEKNDTLYNVAAFKGKLRYTLGTYSTLEKAKKALCGMSKSYKRYLITFQNGYMTKTDDVVCELDKPFEKFDIQELETPYYCFPEDSSL